MPITEDTGNQPAAVHQSGASPATTASFTAQAGTLLVAMIVVNGLANQANTASLSDSQSGTWTLLKRQNTFNASLGGTAEVWCRWVPVATTMTVSASWANDTGANLVVRNLLGANPVQPGATAGNGGASVAPSAALVATVAGSWIYGGVLRYPDSTALTANGSTTIIDQFNDATNGDTFAAIKSSAATSGFASVTYGATNANTAYNTALAEIIPLMVGQPVARNEHPGRRAVPRDGLWTTPKSVIDGAVFAYAGTAQGYGYAYGLNDHSAGLLLALDGAQTGTAQVNAQPTEAAGTGTAYDATVTTSSGAVSGFAEAALGTGTAYDAQAAVGSLPPEAAGTGSAQDAQAAVGAQPPEAAGTGSAFTAASDIAGTSGAATGTGTAGDPQPSVSGLPSEAAGTGTAPDAQGATGAQSGAASGTGLAGDASASLAAQPTEAAGTGTAQDAASSVGALPGAATGTGAAGDGQAAINAQPSEAAGTGSSNTATPDDIQVFADWASGPGVAYDATVQTSGNTNAPAEAAQGTGTAYDAAVAVSSGAGVGSGTGTAFDLSSAAAVVSDWAAGLGTAYDASAQLPQAGTPTLIYGYEPPSLLQGREMSNGFAGREIGLISGRETLSSTSGTEPDSTISGREP